MLAPQDSKLILFRVEQFCDDALGVLRDIGDKPAIQMQAEILRKTIGDAHNLPPNFCLIAVSSSLR